MREGGRGGSLITSYHITWHVRCVEQTRIRRWATENIWDGSSTHEHAHVSAEDLVQLPPGARGRTPSYIMGATAGTSARTRQMWRTRRTRTRPRRAALTSSLLLHLPVCAFVSRLFCTVRKNIGCSSRAHSGQYTFELFWPRLGRLPSFPVTSSRWRGHEEAPAPPERSKYAPRSSLHITYFILKLCVS